MKKLEVLGQFYVDLNNRSLRSTVLMKGLQCSSLKVPLACYYSVIAFTCGENFDIKPLYCIAQKLGSALIANNIWDIKLFMYKASERSERGSIKHIPGPREGSGGGLLGRFCGIIGLWPRSLPSQPVAVAHQGLVDPKHLAAPPVSVCSKLQQLIRRGVS